MSKFIGLTNDDKAQLEGLKVKLIRAREVAVSPINAYNAVLAELHEFAERIDGKAEDWFTDRVSFDGTPHSKAVQTFMGHWHYVQDELAPIEFDAASARHIEVVEALPLKVEGH
jgi:hypothetical protein